MRVFSKIAGGHKSGGGVLLRKGVNTLEEPLTIAERQYVNTLVRARIAKIILPNEAASTEEEVPPPPSSETKIVTTAPRVRKVRRQRGATS